MSQKNSVYHTTLKKHKDGRLVHESTGSLATYNRFVGALEENEIAHLYMEADHPDGTLPQLARVHAAIREIAKKTGDTFQSTKLNVKHRAGLAHKTDIEGDTYLVPKSFAKCSKEELGLAIEATIELGDFLEMNLR